MNFYLGSVAARAVTIVAATVLVSAGGMLFHTADSVAVLQSQRRDDTERLQRIEHTVDNINDILERDRGPNVASDGK